MLFRSISIKPSQEGAILLNLYNAVARKLGAETLSAPESPVDVESIANDLVATKGSSLVLSGTNDVDIQIVVNALNELLGNYGSTLNLNVPLNYKQGIDSGIATLDRKSVV